MGWDSNSARSGRGAATQRGRELRKSLTPQEARLWLQLRAMRAEGFHFRRQAPLLGFFLDFVCFKHRLVIEVDGSQHAESVQAEHDAMRDAILRRRGFHTLRFWNSDINTNLDGVMQMIQRALDRPSLPFMGRDSSRSEQGGGLRSSLPFMGRDSSRSEQGGGLRSVNESPEIQRAAPDSPTRPPLRGGHPPQEGEGGEGS